MKARITPRKPPLSTLERNDSVCLLLGELTGIILVLLSEDISKYEQRFYPVILVVDIFSQEQLAVGEVRVSYIRLVTSNDHLVRV